jgi:hypothetical protein
MPVNTINRPPRPFPLAIFCVLLSLTIRYRKDGNIYEFEYVVPDSALYYLDILFDRERILRFDVHITQ